MRAIKKELPEGIVKRKKRVREKRERREKEREWNRREGKIEREKDVGREKE